MGSAASVSEVLNEDRGGIDTLSLDGAKEDVSRLRSLITVFGTSPEIEDRTASIVKEESKLPRDAEDVSSLEDAKEEIKRLRELLKQELDYNISNASRTSGGAKISICGEYVIEEDGAWRVRGGK